MHLEQRKEDQDIVKMEKGCKVCVTETTSYCGPWLVKKLLEKGYTVHATFKDLNDESENVSILKNLPHAKERLVLFEADIYNPIEFEPAIQVCEFVFYVHLHKNHEIGPQYKNVEEAAIGGAKSIVMSCVKAGTVKRLIFTSSIVSASPLKDDGSGFKDFIDETCWTPLNIDSYEHIYHHEFYRDLTYSRTLMEKHLLSYGNNNVNDVGFEVVTLLSGLVVGDALESCTPRTVQLCTSQLTGNALRYQSLEFFENLLGKIPLAHIHDLCEAHIFCLQNPSLTGRFFCASSFVSSEEIAQYYLLNYPEFHIKQEYREWPKGNLIKWASTKLADKGFLYKYNTDMILDECIKCARRMGDF